MALMKIVVMNWNTMNVKRMNIDVKMDHVFLKNTGWMDRSIAQMDQMNKDSIRDLMMGFFVL
jgi:hypothetical protein